MWIDDSAQAEIKRVIEYAKFHKLDYERIKGIMVGMLPPLDSTSPHSTTVRDCRCIFAIEEQPLGWCLHLSVYAHRPIVAHEVNVLMQAFGFHGTMDLASVWTDGEQAINVIEPCGH